MTDVPIARTIRQVLDELEPLMTFLTRSPWAERLGDPTISDFVAGNPHDEPLPEMVAAFQRWTPPQNKDWYAYKLSETPARTAAAESASRDLGITFEPDDVHLTPGTFGALSVALRTLLDPGDEVIYVSPPWFFYGPMIRVAGGVPVRVTSPPPDFALPVDAIAAAITERTRAVIVNTPCNPTGKIYSRAELDRLGAMLREASGRTGRRIVVLSDESYRRIVFDDNVFVPPAASYADTLVLYTYGKALLAPGERIGYIAVPPSFEGREQLREAIQLSQVVGGWQFPNAVLQHALAELDPLVVDVPRLQQRRDRLVEELRRMGYELHVPDGTFYLLVRSPIEDDWAFTGMLAELDVFVGPGTIFELPGFFRISITANDDMVERALPGFAKAIERVRGG